MIRNQTIPPFFKLVGWPINICAFELGFGYGVGKALHIYFRPEPIPVLVSLISLTVVAFASAYIVFRYTPSDVMVEKYYGSIATILWINVSILLAAGAPIASVLYFDSLFFWVAAVIVGGIKAIHSLEMSKRKGKYLVINEQDIKRRSAKGVIIRQVFSPNPDAYALQPLPTAFFVAGITLGIGMVLIGSIIYSIVGSGIICSFSFFYNFISGLSRSHAKQ